MLDETRALVADRGVADDDWEDGTIEDSEELGKSRLEDELEFERMTTVPDLGLEAVAPIVDLRERPD